MWSSPEGAASSGHQITSTGPFIGSATARTRGSEDLRNSSSAVTALYQRPGCCSGRALDWPPPRGAGARRVTEGRMRHAHSSIPPTIAAGEPRTPP